MANKIYFIVGVGRSGTTLLQNMLNNHPDVAFVPEINYTRRFLLNSKLYRLYKSKNSHFKNFLKIDKWLSRLDERIIDDLDLSSFNKSNFSNSLYLQILKNNCVINNKIIAGDKDPRSIEIVDKINDSVPNIHWIHVVRDPRDVLLSKMKADWSKMSNIYKHIFAAKVQLQFVKKWKDRFKNINEVYYEDIITDTENSLIELCKNINLNYNSSMLRFQNSAKTLIADDEYSWKKEVYKPIDKNNFSKWKTGLSKYQVALCEDLVDIAFCEYKYKKSRPKLNFILELWIGLLKPIYAIISVLYIQLRWRIIV